jgi:hypothetical protein
MWRFFSHPLVFIGLCAAGAYYLMSKSGWAVGSNWYHPSDQAIWTVNAKGSDGSVVFSIMDSLGQFKDMTGAIPPTTLDTYLASGELVAMPAK